MAMETLVNVVDKAYRIFVFNPQTIQVAKEFAAGHYEWSWVLVMLGALFVWNVRCWSFFRDEREKSPQTVFRAAVEGVLHWCLSNAVLFMAIELHTAVYGHFTDYVPVAETPQTTSGIRNAMVGALSKIHLMNQKMTLVPHVRNPYAPFGIMVAASLVVVSLAFLVRKSDVSNREEHGDNNEGTIRGYDWN